MERKYSDFEAVSIVEQQWELAGMEPDFDVFVEAAQHLIDSGLVWQLQGYFGRVCADLIERGFCRPAVEGDAA